MCCSCPCNATQQVRRAVDAPAAAAAAADGSAEVLQLLFECSGSERVDPSWVGHLYKPEVTAIKDHKVSWCYVTC
jgi:hypothetical protein